MEIKTIDCQDTWAIRHRVMWPDKTIDEVKLDSDPIGMHFGLFIADQLVSVVSAFISNTDEAQFRKFATVETMQGKGYGTALLSHVFEVLKQKGVRKIWCNARVEKAFFYQRFGMMKTAETFERSGLKYIIMEMYLTE